MEHPGFSTGLGEDREALGLSWSHRLGGRVGAGLRLARPHPGTKGLEVSGDLACEWG